MTYQETPIIWQEPASEADIEKLTKAIKLPQEHIDFFRKSNGVEADIIVQPYYVQIWSIDVLLESAPFYDDLLWEEEVEMPHILAFGGSGGGEIFFYDRRTRPWKIVCYPGTCLDPENDLDVAPSFTALLEMLGKSDID